MKKLYMVMVGCTPRGRLTEQHDIFFGIADDLKDLVPEMKAFWPETEGDFHIDAWREVTAVDGYRVTVVPKSTRFQPKQLFFINLGGYKPGEFEEYHYKMLAIADSLSAASKKSMATAFYKHCGFQGAVSHIDDRYGIDVDDAVAVADALPAHTKENFSLSLTEDPAAAADTLHIGYLKISKLAP
jgi:hypothetical protein